MTTTALLPVGAPIPSLTRWGLTSDADLVFRTLSTFGAQPARTLASDLGLARQRVEHALAELHECGAAWADTGSGRAMSWVSRPADEVVERLRRRRMRLPDNARTVRRHRAVFQLINKRLTGAGLPLDPVLSGHITEQVDYHSDRTVARQRIAEAMRQERFERLVINNEESEYADVQRVRPLDPSRFRADLSLRVLGQPPSDGDTISPERGLNLPGYSFRETPDTPLKLFVCDRRTAFFPADPADLNRGYFEITHPAVVRTLVDVFEARWAAARDPAATGVPLITLSTREHELVGLLALGHTDVTAAQALRISARSVTNTLRALMDRLGVDNRFQLGLALGALDVTLPPSMKETA